MSYKNNLNSNLKKNYIYVFINTLNLTQGIWMIYLAAKGMSLVQLGILEGIFHVTSFLMEIPTGVIADVYGRKASRILGRTASFISIIILIYSNNFYWFMISFIISALSYNLESGAGDALIYDSLKELDEENRYMKISGNNEMFMQIASILAYILGGYLATKSYLAAFILSAIFAAISFAQAFYFTEPKIKSNTLKEKNAFIILKKQVKDSIYVISNNRKIGYLIVFSNFISVISTSLFYYLQNFWKFNNFSEFKIGIIFSISSFLGAITASKVYKIEAALKEKGILILLPFISVICLWGIVFTKLTYVFFIFISIIEVIIFITINDYVNKQIPSENRATILSFSSMVFSFYMIIIFPLIGKIGDLFSLNFAFKSLAIAASIVYIIHFVAILNTKRI